MTIKLTVSLSLCLLFMSVRATPGGLTSEDRARLQEIFSTEETNHQHPVNVKTCGENMECVPRFLCNEDGAVRRDGATLINSRFGNQCKYFEVCCNVSDKLPEEPVIAQEVCGYRNPNGVSFRNTGDNEGQSKFGEFPWMVAILRQEVIYKIKNLYFLCGGSVIAPNVVMTAAHCVKQTAREDLIASAGKWDLNSSQEAYATQDARVKEIILHENFHERDLYNDMALLILETPYYWQANVRPICLPKTNMNFDFSHCYGTGWGKNKFGPDGVSAVIMKKITLSVVPYAPCQANLRRTRLGKSFNLDASFICARGDTGRDTCEGDGGSPLVCPDPQNPTRYYQAGIVAGGIGCGEEDVPGVYTNVPYLRNWINEKLSARGINVSN